MVVGLVWLLDAVRTDLAARVRGAGFKLILGDALFPKVFAVPGGSALAAVSWPTNRIFAGALVGKLSSLGAKHRVSHRRQGPCSG